MYITYLHYIYMYGCTKDFKINHIRVPCYFIVKSLKSSKHTLYNILCIMPCVSICNPLPTLSILSCHINQ